MLTQTHGAGKPFLYKMPCPLPFNIGHRSKAVDADWGMLFINTRCRAPIWLNKMFYFKKKIFLKKKHVYTPNLECISF